METLSEQSSPERFTSIFSLLEFQAQTRGGSVAIESASGDAMDFKTLHRRVLSRAQGLRARGAVNDSRYAIVLPNGPDMAVALLGVSCAVVAAPLNPACTEQEFEDYLSQLEVDGVILGKGVESPVRSAAAHCGIPLLELTLGFPDGPMFEEEPVDSGFFPAGGEAVALVLLTSVLAAVAGAIACGIDLKQCAQSLNGITAFPRRMSLHQTKNGIWFVNDTFKAPFWSVSKVLAQLEHARAPRKTVVFGSFSDPTGSDSPKYRTMARTALAFCDRVMFVGKKADYVRKLFSSENEGRLFAFDEAQEACRLLKETALRDELILVKSNTLEHLERLIYRQDTELYCWKTPCPKRCDCRNCDQSGVEGAM